MADRGRVALCGQISQYNLAEPELGPRNLRSLVGKQVRIEGFLVYQFRRQGGGGRAAGSPGGSWTAG